MPPLTITADCITTTNRITANPDLEKIERQLDQMETDMNYLGDKNREMAEEIRRLYSNLAIRDDKIKDLNTTISNLQAEVSWLESELVRVRSEVEAHE